jgi:glucosamine--fructose-6-phosphate aminotransferase (isomerizing)
VGPDHGGKGGYKHFMLKEVYEQPRSIRDTTLGRVGQETSRIFRRDGYLAQTIPRVPADQDHRLRYQLHAALAGNS